MQYLVVLAVILGATLCNGRPNSEKVYESSMVSSSDTSSSVNGFHVAITTSSVDGECVSTLTITGNGINKKAEYPCPKEQQSIISLNKTLLVGDEFFTDEPGTLIHLKDGKCEKEVFTEKDGTYTSSMKPMDEKECETVKTKISVLKEEQEKWNEWYKTQEEQTQQQLQQMQENLLAMQQQIFGMFGGMPFGK